MANSSTSGQGRPKGALNLATRSVRELAGHFSNGAIKVLAQILLDPLAPPAAKVAAAREILDRAHGKPSATATVTLKKDATLAEMGERIISAATNGSLPLDHAGQLMAALAAQAKLHETTELIQRLELIEALIATKEPEK